MGCSNNAKDPVQFAIDKIKEKVTIDNILNFHNGNIPSIFYNNDSLIVDKNQISETQNIRKVQKR